MADDMHKFLSLYEWLYLSKSQYNCGWILTGELVQPSQPCPAFLVFPTNTGLLAQLDTTRFCGYRGKALPIWLFGASSGGLIKLTTRQGRDKLKTDNMRVKNHWRNLFFTELGHIDVFLKPQLLVPHLFLYQAISLFLMDLQKVANLLNHQQKSVLWCPGPTFFRPKTRWNDPGLPGSSLSSSHRALAWRCSFL